MVDEISSQSQSVTSELNKLYAKYSPQNEIGGSISQSKLNIYKTRRDSLKKQKRELSDRITQLNNKMLHDILPDSYMIPKVYSCNAFWLHVRKY